MANISPTRKGWLLDRQAGLLAATYLGASPGAVALAANTALTNIFLGTPVVPALPVDSIIISDLVTNGDIVLATNNGGNSQAFLQVDSSAGVLNLLGAGTQVIEVAATAVAIANGIVKLTLGTVSTFGTTQPTNALVFRSGTAPAGAITTASALFATDTVLQKIIAAGTVSNVET